MVWTPKLRTALLLLLAATVDAYATSGPKPPTPGADAHKEPLPRVLTPTTPVTTPGTTTHQPGQWPKTLPKDAGTTAAEKAWPAEEIQASRQRCDALLAGLDIVALPAEPIRDGDCGAAAPIELISVGRNPQVTFSSPAIVTCDVAVAFDKWLKSDLQASAREHLGSPIMRVEIMSAYSCRNAYGRKKTRVSEHGKANALDIRGFLTEKGVTVDLLADWGPTERDIRAQIAAAAAKAKAEEEKAEALKREAEKTAAARNGKSQSAGGAQPTPSISGTSEGTSAPAPLRGTVDESPTIAGGTKSWRPNPSLSLTPPSRLGGPKADKDKKHGKPAGALKEPGPTAAAPVPAVPQTPKTRFLRRAHVTACKTFGTVLGPEANEAHRNHFHIDMAERQSGSYCE